MEVEAFQKRTRRLNGIWYVHNWSVLQIQLSVLYQSYISPLSVIYKSYISHISPSRGEPGGCAISTGRPRTGRESQEAANKGIRSTSNWIIIQFHKWKVSTFILKEWVLQKSLWDKYLWEKYHHLYHPCDEVDFCSEHIRLFPSLSLGLVEPFQHKYTTC